MKQLTILFLLFCSVCYSQEQTIKIESVITSSSPGSTIPIGRIRASESTPEINLLDSFDLYADFYSASDSVFANGAKLENGLGILKGYLMVHDASTGQIGMTSTFLTGYGDADATDHIIYGDTVTREFGRVFRLKWINNTALENFYAGFCKPDISDCVLSDAWIYSGVSDAFNINIPTGSTLIGKRTDYAEFEFLFFLGGFDVNGLPYTGTNKTNYTYGSIVFIRGGGYYPYWKLLGYNQTSSTAALVPFVAFRAAAGGSYESVKITHMSSYLIDDLPVLNKVSIATGNNDQFTLDTNNFVLQAKVTLANPDSVSLYFCMDNVSPAAYTNGYRLTLARNTTVSGRLWKKIDNVESLIGTSTAITYSATGNVAVSIFNNNLRASYNKVQLANIDDGTPDATLVPRNRAAINKTTNSNFLTLSAYKSGYRNIYNDSLYYQPARNYFSLPTPPGYGLPAEARKGWYFDVSGQSHFGQTKMGVIAYLTNGSSTMVVKYRNHNDKTFNDSMTFNVTLKYAYSGDNKIVYLGSDPHFGYAISSEPINNSSLVYRDIICPDLDSLNVTDCFILGDIAQDGAGYSSTFYDLYLTAKGLYSANWHELIGNHDTDADFKTKLGYTTTYQSVDIGNCHFIMLGDSVSAKINATFLSAELDANTDKNCFIMTHQGRYNTTVNTDAEYPTKTGDAYLLTAIGSRKFVIWFCGHSHGYIANTRKFARNKWLFLGNNN